VTDNYYTADPKKEPDKGRRVLAAVLAVITILIACVAVRRFLLPAGHKFARKNPASEPQISRKARPASAHEPADQTPSNLSPVTPAEKEHSHASDEQGKIQEPTKIQQQKQSTAESDEISTSPHDADSSEGGLASDAVRIMSINTKYVPTPVYEVDNGPTNVNPPRLWYAITVEFESVPEWLDTLTLDYWVMIGSDSREYGKRVLWKRVTYLDVSQGVHRTAVYLHQNTWRRFGPASNIAVSITEAGRIVTFASLKNEKDRSWLKPTDYVRLLLREETPFGLIDHDLFEFEKPAVSGGEGKDKE
jgi:hypothetical protein